MRTLWEEVSGWDYSKPNRVCLKCETAYYGYGKRGTSTCPNCREEQPNGIFKAIIHYIKKYSIFSK